MISGMLNRLFFGAATIETLGHPASGIIGWLGGNATASGVAVTDENAYDYSPVFAATRFLSSQIGDFPVRLMKGWRDAKRRKGAGRDIAVEHPVYRLVYDTPNPLMTASVFRASQIVHQVNAGNCYAEIERDGNGSPLALWPIHPSRISPQRDGASLYYAVRNDKGLPSLLEKEEVLHVPSPISCDGISGKGVFQHARESIGAGLKVQQHVGYTFANGAVPRTVLKHPRNMNKEARQNLREEWQQLYGGTENAGKTAVLWEGMELQTLSMSNADAQFLESMKFGINEIARFYGVPPYVLQDMDRATWSNLEQLGRSIVQMSFMPYIIRWEEELDRKLLTQDERDEGYYTFFDVDEWQRGDAQGRATANQIKFRNGVLSQDEWRAEEDDDPLPDKLGEKFYVTADLIEVGKPPEPVEPVMPPASEPDADEAPPANDNADARLAAEKCFTDIFSRLVRVEMNAAKQAAKKPDRWFPWLDEFYGRHEGQLSTSLEPIGGVLRALGAEVDVAGMSKSHCETSRQLLIEASDAKPAVFESVVANLVSSWEERASRLVAGWEDQPRDDIGRWSEDGGVAPVKEPSNKKAGKSPKPGAPLRHNPKEVSATSKSLAARTARIGMSAEQTKGVKDYTSAEYLAVNSALRDGRELSPSAKVSYDHLQDAIRRSGPIDPPATVYRGVRGPAAAALIAQSREILRSGSGEIVAKGMTSTSLSSKVPDQFGKDVTMRIRAKSGVYVEGITANKKEYELIQNHGTRYRPLAISQHGSRTIIDMEEI